MKPSTVGKSILVSANESFQRQEYSKALNLYAQVIQSQPEMAEHIRFNIAIAITLLRNPRSSQIQFNPNTSLVPAQDIVANSDSGAGWISKGNDPYFFIDNKGPSFAEGWYLVDVLMTCKKRKSISRLYADYGSGFSEQGSFNLKIKNNEVCSRIIYFPGDVKLLRFDPLEYPGPFCIHAFQIQKLTEIDAKNHIILFSAQQNSGTDGSSSFTLSDANPGNIQDIYKLYSDSLNEDKNDSTYADWIENTESVHSPSRELAQCLTAKMSYTPKISILLPTYNTDGTLLKECIESVIAQTYENWELCIADDASTDPFVAKILDAYAKKDNRIKYTVRAKNGHISRCSNSALALATGEYCALLDHDDLLANNALLHVAIAINENTGCKIIYSDEDKIDINGMRFEPHFKSDWNPELFYSQNYVSHLGVYQTSLLKKVKGFRTGVEGSQDYDLMLRCLEHVEPEQIVHIPHILYHWRVLEGSTAMAAGEKSYTSDAGVKALKHHFAKLNRSIRVEIGPAPNTYRVHWPIPKNPPLVSLLIPTRDRRNLTEVAVRSILEKTSYKNFEIIILDNGSVEQDTLEFFAEIQLEYENVRVINYDYPFNYSAINNFGAKFAKGKLIGLVNNDVEVINNGWLTEMVSYAIRKEVGCVGAKLYYSNDTIQHAGVICSLGGVAGHSHKHFHRDHPGYFYRLKLPQTLSAVTAACLLVRKEVFAEVKGLDEENLKVAFNDVDFCLRVQAAGYRNLWTPYAELYHYESISRGAEDSPEKIRRFQSEIEFMKSRWSVILDRDPYYNPNLTKDREDFSLSQV